VQNSSQIITANKQTGQMPFLSPERVRALNGKATGLSVTHKLCDARNAFKRKLE